jgi:hypothetical protein
MATFGGAQPIVTDGLVFAVDAANYQSYPGSGTTWSDLSGNGNNGTLVNGPAFDSGNGGSIVFDGTNDYVEVIDFLPNNNDFTLTLWLNYSDLNPSVTGIISTWDSNWKGWGFAGRNGFFRSWINDGAAGGKDWVSLSEVYNEWHLVTLRYKYSTGTQSFYLDTTSYGSDSTIRPVSPSNLQIGRGGQTGTVQLNSYTYSNCKISNLKIYNRVLTEQEITQNYNALKGRFGL